MASPLDRPVQDSQHLTNGSNEPLHDVHTQNGQRQSLELQVSDLFWPMNDDNSANWGFADDDFIRQVLDNDVSPPAFSSMPLFDRDPTHSGAISDELSQRIGETDDWREPLAPNTGGSLLPISLDHRKDCSTTMIGFSNESDPFALNGFPYNNQDEIDFFRVTYRRLSPKESTDHPLHFLQSQSLTATETRKVVEDCTPKLDDRTHLESLVDHANGAALVRLYFRFVFPSLPILSRSLVLKDINGFVKEAPTGLLAGIYALALPFAAWDESLCLHNAYAPPDVAALWKITYTSLNRELHFPRLFTIQTFLLLLNYLPFDSVSVENPFAWSMAASMLAMAQSLGLNVDPSGWNIPAWEIRLRRRLWWSVSVEHIWRSITHGRSSMLNDDDWDVTPLTLEDFVIDHSVSSGDSGLDISPGYFIHLCSLSLIAGKICREFL